MSDKDNENTSTNSTDDLVRDLIDAVKQEEIIYKPGHKYFRHLIKKHQAYLSVSQHLNSLGYKEISGKVTVVLKNIEIILFYILKIM